MDISDRERIWRNPRKINDFATDIASELDYFVFRCADYEARARSIGATETANRLKSISAILADCFEMTVEVEQTCAAVNTEPMTECPLDLLFDTKPAKPMVIHTRKLDIRQKLGVVKSVSYRAESPPALQITS
ncbi:hypothetical protein [Roseibium sp. RKSG952]|uniref:hypothetical protein n=1 Tax=Roseibium sp. RKSG952 TaxID=2529384 RepID=UPI0012BC48D7|nr:hypothetical protein [Roseibium sp. RKSG952]MTH95535.1 hypothetical protein [Roseibium sp. RKSG952]